ncbi:delta-latroinsectotoxin-Lt1a [Trichoderma asperellum]|uniref:Delta-latroinsectotoxin-Lt1a n=1 Tax=Trichoderma asperellum TaxID=101201 RepID=A0A6V8QPA9_TRIAP|nr:delta-latroinsectotoxin-Lt1a [Trichoderma asperellum]
MWWDRSSMYIRCPYCDDIHQHTFIGDYQDEQYREPHCGHREDYRICFPRNGQYEIDKIRGFLVRAGVDPTEYSARFDPVETVDVSDKRKWSEAKEEVEMDEHYRDILQQLSWRLGLGPIQEFGLVNRLEVAVSDMIGGRVKAVRSYLETSPEKDIFLHGVETSQRRQHDIGEWDAYQDLLKSGRAGDLEPSEEKIVETPTSGITTLHMAARGKYPEMVKLLLDHGADPNARTVNGRTPLMEAALWGRLDNVKHLLDHGADKSVQCVRKGVKHRAIDFARYNKDNSKERYDLFREKHQVYEEDTYERDEEREAIVWELSDEAADDDHYGQASVLRLQGFTFTPVINGGSIVSMLTNFDVHIKKKTIGILFRSDLNEISAFPPVAAMSGWSHEPTSDLNVQIAGKKWINEVFYLCQIIGHELPELKECDWGKPGQFYACHAEKQLIAYLVSKHVFLPRDIEDEDEGFGLANLSLSEFQGDQSPRQRVRELKNIEPLQRLKDATILVTRTVCDDCRVFAERVNKTLGLNIQVRDPSSCT